MFRCFSIVVVLSIRSIREDAGEMSVEGITIASWFGVFRCDGRELTGLFT